ncbi:MAG: zinc-dependent peptidase [Deltaproteobacteria bacterium]|nr:zinc-dependent peptidase [Deltaproteobacteria bacterium]
MFGIWRAWRRRRLAREPVPDTWRAILASRVPFYRNLPAAEQERFCELVWIFGREKHFIGAGGLEITDEHRAVISACAVRLAMNLDLSRYDRLTEILVYPYVYTHPEGGAIFGEAHAWGTVVLSWPAVLQGLADPGDGLETGAHEFAHVLDRVDGAFDGTPELRARADYAPWVEAMSRRFLGLQRRQKAERRVLRRYGATNEAEFFAVATESFFEKPRQMKERTPDLYAVLQAFYGGDPAATADPAQAVPRPRKIQRNDPCPCGSGKKYKRCCGR